MSDDKSRFEVLHDRVDAIKRVFEMRVIGYGVVATVRRANKERWPVPGHSTTWHTSLVGRLLGNRALLGEYQPHQKVGEDGKRVPSGDLILGYYPKVIDEELFLRAQAVSERRGGLPGRRDVNNRNFLQGMLRCSCGHSFVWRNKTSSKQPGYARYYCSARNRGLSECPSLAAQEIENAVLNTVATIAPAYFVGTARAESLKSSLEMLRIEVGSVSVTY